MHSLRWMILQLCCIFTSKQLFTQHIRCGKSTKMKRYSQKYIQNCFYRFPCYYVCTNFRIELIKICSVYMFKSVCVIKARLRKVKYQLIKNKQANSPSSFHSIYQSAFTFYLFLRTLSSTMKNTIVFMTLDISRIKCHQGRKQKFLAHQILFKSSNFYSNVKLPEIIVTPLLRHFLFELKQIFMS